jgi:LysM repeat protein
MALPSQSARSQSISGRSFSSRRRRRSGLGGVVVLGGALLVLAGLIYGGLWAFGVVGGGGESDKTLGETDRAGQGEAVQGETVAKFEPTTIDQGQPVAIRSVKPEITEAKQEPETTEIAERGDEAPVRRNLLREGFERARSGGAGELIPGEQTGTGTSDASKDGEVLATNNGGSGSPGLMGTAAAVAGKLAEADRLLKNNEPLEAREVLNAALHSPRLSEDDAATLRTKLGQLNADLVFSPRVVEGDPLSEVYVIQGGDRLSKIASKRELAVHWKLIQRVNGLSNPNRIREGQKLKLVRGPFHAVVDKSDFRVDIFHGQPNDPESWLYIRSFDVGLGKEDGTPIGTFVVARDSKVSNPAWVNPHDPSERYGRDDPGNPIGEYWIGLEGLGDAAAFVGYGLHGTIEPQSVGTEASLGCVRLRPEDIEQVYELLVEGISVVKIVP